MNVGEEVENGIYRRTIMDGYMRGVPCLDVLRSWEDPFNFG
jgi:hypothetical protein